MTTTHKPTIDSQRRRILDALSSGSWWTTAALELESGAKRVAARIHELRHDCGHAIESRLVPCGNGNQQAEYRLAPKWCQPEPSEDRIESVRAEEVLARDLFGSRAVSAQEAGR